MKILYVGTLHPNSTSLQRREAIARLGHELIDFDMGRFESRGSYFTRAMRLRLLLGPTIIECNRELLSVARRTNPDIIWFDKAVYIWGSTVRTLRQAKIFTVHYNIDNPFGPRNDPGWRLALKALPEYDLHLVQRDKNLTDYRDAGARDVFMLRTGFDPTRHFPPPPDWSDKDRPYEVSFIGTPYDSRAQFVTDLWQKHGIEVKVWGDIWQERLDPATYGRLWQGPCVYGDDYRETIWRSRLCLSFVTHSNEDDVAHKTFEIAACGTPLLAEGTAGHLAHFQETDEALFFENIEDCANKIKTFINNENFRIKMSRNALARCKYSGYSYDDRIQSVFSYIREKYYF